MPIGLRFSKIINNKLPKELGKKAMINQQIKIWGSEDYNREGHIEYIGKGEFGNYDKYKISYHIVEKVSGYYMETKVDSILVEEEKFFFVSPDNKYLLFRASKKDSAKIAVLLKESGLIDIVGKELDMKDLKEKLANDKSRIKSIVGAWITNLQDININTVAIFGTEIDQSEEFGDYVSQEESKISMLIIDLGEETIGITQEYGAIFYNRRSELKLLEGYEIIKELLSSLGMFV